MPGASGISQHDEDAGVAAGGDDDDYDVDDDDDDDDDDYDDDDDTDDDNDDICNKEQIRYLRTTHNILWPVRHLNTHRTQRAGTLHITDVSTPPHSPPSPHTHCLLNLSAFVAGVEIGV